MNDPHPPNGIDIGFKYGIIAGIALIAVYLYVYLTKNLSAPIIMGSSIIIRILATLFAGVRMRQQPFPAAFRQVLQATFAAIVVSYIVTMFFDYFFYNNVEASYLQMVKEYGINTTQNSMKMLGAPTQIITQTIDEMNSVDFDTGFIGILKQLMYKIYFSFFIAAIIAFLLTYLAPNKQQQTENQTDNS